MVARESHAHAAARPSSKRIKTEGARTGAQNVNQETDLGANNLAPIGRRRPDAVTRLGSRRQQLPEFFMVAHRTDDRQPPITSQKVHIHNPPYVI